MVTSKPRMIFSRLSADAKATGFSRYVVYLYVEEADDAANKVRQRMRLGIRILCCE